MTDLRKRPAEGTLQQRVYRALRRASMAADLIAADLYHPRETVRKAADYLVQRGVLARHPYAGRLIIYSIVRGRQEPTDRRGKAPTCRNHRGQAAYAKWLLMMKAKHGPAWRPKPKGHALDEVWRAR